LIAVDSWAMVSIGDLVKWTITAQQEVISHLEAYIGGGTPQY
jgi:hypothetical protein